MSKLKIVEERIIFASNGLPVMTLTRHEDGKEELFVVLPEGVRLVVLPADSGLAILRHDVTTQAPPSVSLYARRVAPKPVLEEKP